MKNTVLILILLLTLNAYSQPYWAYTIDFEDTSQFFRISFDTTITSNNTWQIGEPQKTIFDGAYSLPNAIVTDTLNTYPSNDTSIFLITHITCDGFIWPHTVILSGYYKSDSDSLNDYGLIEFSPDNGETWIDLINDTVYSQYYEWSSPKPALTGRVNEWTNFYVNLAGLGYVFDIDYQDTVYYKFTFISDEIEEQMDGLMYDNLHFEDWFEIINEHSEYSFSSKVFPSPATLFLAVEFENSEHHTMELSIVDMNGNCVLPQEKTSEKAFHVNTEKLVSGLYFYKVTDLETNRWSSGKFVIEK